MSQGVTKTGGWAWPGLARKAHYFSSHGRSLCGSWLFFGEADPNQQVGEEPGKDDCVRCFNLLKKERLYEPVTV